jgi:hypothetical protein
MEIWQWLKLILLWVTVAGYALLALGIFVHAFFRGRKRERSAGWSIANVSDSGYPPVVLRKRSWGNT